MLLRLKGNQRLDSSNPRIARLTLNLTLSYIFTLSRREARGQEKNEVPAKPLEPTGNRHSGQAKRDPESRIVKGFWIPAPAPDLIRGSRNDGVRDFCRSLKWIEKKGGRLNEMKISLFLFLPQMGKMIRGFTQYLKFDPSPYPLPAGERGNLLK
jgi:hypothetical protein